MNKPKMPKIDPAERITPMPDLQGANQQQAKYDALKALMGKRGRSSTIMTFNKKRLGDISGRLSDVPEGGRTSPDIVRGA